MDVARVEFDRAGKIVAKTSKVWTNAVGDRCVALMEQTEMIRALFHWWPIQPAEKVVTRIWYDPPPGE